MKSVGLPFILIFGLVGAGLLIGAAIAFNHTLSFRSGTKTAEGVVVSDPGQPVVEWADSDGMKRRLTAMVRSSPPSYSIGDRVIVRYAPDRPEHARIDSFMENWFVALILGGIGSVFFSIGAGIGLHGWRKRKNREWLEHHGTRIQAKSTGVVHDTGLRVNGRSPWRLTAQWQNPATSAIHTFRSDAIWFDPSEFVKGETLDVLVNLDKPSRYHVDVSFLPEHAG